MDSMTLAIFTRSRYRRATNSVTCVGGAAAIPAARPVAKSPAESHEASLRRESVLIVKRVSKRSEIDSEPLQP